MPLDCTMTRALLSEYLDGELPGSESLSVKLHLEGCPGCARLAAELAATVAALHGLAAAGAASRLRRKPVLPS